jgi:hypothetical protein
MQFYIDNAFDTYFKNYPDLLRMKDNLQMLFSNRRKVILRISDILNKLGHI